MSQKTDDRPGRGEQQDDRPAKTGCIGEIPDLQVGDKIRVDSGGVYRSDKTLTVSEIGTDAPPTGILERRCDGGYVLEGYGTEYHLYVTGTPNWKAVNLTWPSHDTADRVNEIEVIERSENVE